MRRIAPRFWPRKPVQRPPLTGAWAATFCDPDEHGEPLYRTVVKLLVGRSAPIVEVRE
jgi:hypothetical protein